MRKTDIWIGVLCCFLLIACDGKKQKSLSVNDDNKSLTFTLPEVPIMLQSPDVYKRQINDWVVRFNEMDM